MQELLGLFLYQNIHVVIQDIKGDVVLNDSVKKVIVFKNEDQIHIYKCDEDLDEGTAVNMDTTDSTHEK